MASSTKPAIRLQASSFFSMGSSGSTCILASSSPMRARSLGSVMHSLRSAGEWRHDAVEKQPRDQQSNPDHEPKQRDHVHRGQLANTLLPELAHIGHQPDGEEGE